MNALRPHRLWIAILLVAIFIAAAGNPLLHFAQEKAAHNLADTKTARMETEHNLQQLLDNVIAARKLNRQIDRAQAEQYLAPVDRLKAAAALEKEAEIYHLAHFAYSVSPEQHVTVTDGEVQELTLSTVTLAGDAPDDLVVYDFIERVRSVLPGRARIQQLTVARIGDALTAENTHFSASIEWLSNGAYQTVGGL